MIKKISQLAGVLALSSSVYSNAQTPPSPTIRVATFNVSMDGSNYSNDVTKLKSSPLPQLLKEGKNQQIHNIATIIQQVRPDIILLNEFDYTDNWQLLAQQFVKNFLNQPHQGTRAINYPYAFSAPVNTGVPAPLDVDGDGKKSHSAADNYGFGFYAGQYGMLVLSKYPINIAKVRSFQKLKWHSMPNAKQPMLNGKPFFDASTWQNMRLSSKSFWDLPISVNGKTLHLLASHPTPPVFDGEENRNGLRNHDEIRLIADYISDKPASYLIDDAGKQGGLGNKQRFVIVGDLNAAPHGDKARPEAIGQLLSHVKVNTATTPRSKGAEQAFDSPFGAYFTASWAARVDYVLPSHYGLKVEDAGVFWPVKNSPLASLVEKRESSSDHRLVWVDLKITK